MSTWGRAQDALWDRLFGCEDGTGNFYPGPLHDVYKDKPPKEFTDLIEDILEVVAPMFEETGERVARARLLAEMSEVGISFGDPK
jgi:hypothetical protein